MDFSALRGVGAQARQVVCSSSEDEMVEGFVAVFVKMGQISCSKANEIEDDCYAYVCIYGFVGVMPAVEYYTQYLAYCVDARAATPQWAAVGAAAPSLAFAGAGPVPVAGPVGAAAGEEDPSSDEDMLAPLGGAGVPRYEAPRLRGKIRADGTVVIYK
jgi:hypothetical protein